MEFKKLRSLWRKVYPADKYGGIICPICGNGSGKTGTGISEWKDGYLSCFKCGFHGDILDLVREDLKTDYEGAVKFILEKSGEVSVEVEAKNLAEEYCLKRGISKKIYDKFELRFETAWKHPKDKNARPSPHLLIPTSKESFLSYDLETFNKKKVGRHHFFNFDVLNQREPVFAVEGEFDALSVEEVGGHAVALGGVSNIKNFVSELKKLPEVPILLLALDSDFAGIKAEEKLKSLLNAENFLSYRANINFGNKDPNESLLESRKLFSERVLSLSRNPRYGEVEEIESTADYFNTESMIELIRGEHEVYSTGFRHLDAILDGGLYAGLYVLGAISSLGKTTFCLQMMDNIAKEGNDVIFFSLEMARDELMAKAISRISMNLSLQRAKNIKFAVTTREILKGGLKHYADKMEIVEEAFAVRNEYSLHIYTKVGTGDIGVKEIRKIVKRHVEVTGRRPVVFVDYLQMLALNEHLSDKQNVDKAILELKRISRDFDIPVVCISSFNRENYNTAVNLTSFKESGAIEYSSDVLIGLQYDYMSISGNETNSQRTERIYREQQANFEKSAQGKPVTIELKVLKNRNGAKGSTFFNFWERYNLFTEK